MKSWPVWAQQWVWTAAVVGGAYLGGWVLRAVAGPWLNRLAARTAPRWDNVLIAEVGRRLPLWSVLVGLFFALPEWGLPQPTHVLLVRVIQAVGIASVTFALAAVLGRLLVDYGARVTVPVSGLSQNVVRIVVTLVGALVIVRSFGYDITPMLTVLGVGGLTVALALQEPLSNFFAGVFVSLAGQVRIGDYVRLDSGAEGYVVDFKWRSTRLRQLSDVMIDVPNAKLAQAILTNFSQSGTDLALSVEMTVEAASDLEMVEREALEVARAVSRALPGAVSTGEPTVRFTAFTDVGVRLSVVVRTPAFAEQATVRHALIKGLHERFALAGIALADVRGASAPSRRGVPTG